MISNFIEVKMQKISNSSLSRELVWIIKGVSITLMVIHHCFGFPEWYVSGIEYPNLLKNTTLIAGGTQICVPIFAFLTGWLYCNHNDKSIKYSLKKIVNFLMSYWVDLLLIMLLALVFSDYRPSISEICLEMVPIKEHPLMIFAWYVIFYVATLLVLPLFAYMSQNIERKTSVIFICFGCMFVIEFLQKSLNPTGPFFWYLYQWFPCVLAGYYFAQFHLLPPPVSSSHASRILSSFPFFLVLQKNRRFLNVIFGSICLILSIYLQIKAGFSYGISNGYITAPLFILGIVLTFKTKTIFSFVFILLGKHSMNIWFLHCIFFSWITRDVFQPFAYSLQSPFLVVCTVLLTCFICSLFITKIQMQITKRVNLIFSSKNSF